MLAMVYIEAFEVKYTRPTKSRTKKIDSVWTWNEVKDNKETPSVMLKHLSQPSRERLWKNPSRKGIILLMSFQHQLTTYWKASSSSSDPETKRCHRYHPVIHQSAAQQLYLGEYSWKYYRLSIAWIMRKAMQSWSRTQSIQSTIWISWNLLRTTFTEVHGDVYQNRQGKQHFQLRFRRRCMLPTWPMGRKTKLMEALWTASGYGKK
jgi:hypothetical protein